MRKKTIKARTWFIIYFPIWLIHMFIFGWHVSLEAILTRLEDKIFEN